MGRLGSGRLQNGVGDENLLPEDGRTVLGAPPSGRSPRDIPRVGVFLGDTPIEVDCEEIHDLVMSDQPTTSSPTEQPPPPPGTVTARRLTRRSHDRVVAGVAGGLADYFALDPIVFRIAFVALTIAGGSGLLIYLIGWLAIPEVGENTTFAERLIRRIKRTRWMGLTLIVVAVAIMLGQFDGVGSPLFWAVGLVVIGAMLLREEPDRAPAERAVGPGCPSEPGVAIAQPRTRRRRSPLGLYTLGAMLVIVGGAAAVARTVNLDVGQYFALGLTIVGIGLLIGAWWGRSRLLIVVGIALIPLVAAASIVEMPLQGTIGSRYLQSRRVLRAGDQFQTLVGDINLDFSRFNFSDSPADVSSNVVVGNTNVYVPPGVAVHVTGSLNGGHVNLFGEEKSGTDLNLTGDYSRPGSTEGALHLTINGGLGAVTLTWAKWVEDEIRYEQRHQKKKNADKPHTKGTK
jgi:phage shock protein PspC (stress-responsive transcriptional regulator)